MALYDRNRDVSRSGFSELRERTGWVPPYRALVPSGMPRQRRSSVKQQDHPSKRSLAMNLSSIKRPRAAGYIPQNTLIAADWILGSP